MHINIFPLIAVFNASCDTILPVSILLTVKTFAFFPHLANSFHSTSLIKVGLVLASTVRRGDQHLPQHGGMQQWSRLTVRAYCSFIAYSNIRCSCVVTNYRDNNARRAWYFNTIHVPTTLIPRPTPFFFFGLHSVLFSTIHVQTTDQVD